MNKLAFRYNECADETQENLVLAFNELTSEFRSGKSDSKEYKEHNAKFNEGIVKYCVEAAGLEYKGLDMVKNPQLALHNSRFVETFQTVLAQAITPVVPDVLSQEFNNFWDIQQVGWGDNCKFEVKSNKYFLINDLAEGVSRGARQTQYDTEYTIQASPRTVSIAVDWYKVASGVFSWGEMGAKLAVSYRSWLMAMVIKGMTSVITNRASLGLSGYYKAGASATNWVNLAQIVAAANGDSAVYALGTKVGLAKIVPDEAGFRFTSDDDLVTQGFLNVYKGVSTVEMKQAILPTTLNGTNPTLVVPDDYIYFIPMSFNKPVKVVVEGENVVLTTDPLKTKDHTLAMDLTMHIGIGTIVGSKFGILDVSND